MLRSCLRAVGTLAHLPGADASASLQGFLKKVVLVAPLKDKYLQVGGRLLGGGGGGEVPLIG